MVKTLRVSGPHAWDFARSLMMKSAIVSTEANTFMPVCSSAIVTPRLRSSSNTSSRTSIESSPRPSPNKGVESPISSAEIGSLRLRTIACLISVFKSSIDVVIRRLTSTQASVNADDLARNIARGVRREKRHDRGNFASMTETADRHGFQVFGTCRLGYGPQHLGLD